MHGIERLNKVRLLQILVAIVAMVWTGILYGLHQWASHAERQHLDELIALRAESVAGHTQALRTWVGGHGGVYVEMNAGENQPNIPGDLPENELVTPSGRKLVLLSSSAVLGMIMKEFKSGSGDHVRLTSIRPMNPDNTPDDWEIKALAALEDGAKKIEEFVSTGEESRFRLMFPMELQPRCLRCHEYLVDSPTKIVGGLSVMVDMHPYDRQYHEILQHLSLGYFGVWLVGIAGLGAFGIFGSGLLRRLEYASTHDGLTGLLNRREIGRLLTAECERAERYHHQLSLLLLDVDHFKQVNDTHGHQTGDLALRAMTETIRKTIRGTDIAGRYGGEEFLILAPATSGEEADRLAQRLNRAIKDTTMTLPDNRTMALTASIGVSSLGPERKTPDALLQGADAALYQAKEEGRDRVVIVSS